MADKLEWLNKHFVLFKYKTLQETVEKEKYKVRPDLAPFAPEGITCSDYLWNLVNAEKNKDACDFLAYTMHHRAAIWWGYRCLLTLMEELANAPAVSRDIADIAAPKPMQVPDWAKEPEPTPEDAAETAAEKSEYEAELAKLQNAPNEIMATLRKVMPPYVMEIWDKAYGTVDAEFKKLYGIDLNTLLKKAGEKNAEPLFEIDPNSPIFVETEKLKTQLEAQRQETIALIKSVLPPKVPQHEKEMRDNAMQAIYRWVSAPDEANTQAAFNIGNDCPDTPAGMMAMAAFWSFGDLAPEGKQIVPTPPGLAANGICSSLLQAALAKGGTRKYKERCQLYLDLGLKVAWGEDNWADSLTKKEAPHTNIQPTANAETRDNNTYKKWTPAQKQGNGKGEK